MPDTLTFDHAHLSAPDPAEACRWYVQHLGARPGASPERVLLGDERWLIFYKSADAPPSRDSVIHSLGFSFENVAAKVDELVSAGAVLVATTDESSEIARTTFVDDPFGARLAIVQDEGASGFHHVRLRVPDPGRVVQWYLEMFGGWKTSFGSSPDAIRYGGMRLVVERGQGRPSEGRAIDHLGWRTPQLEATAAYLKEQHVTFTMEPRQFNEHVRICFVTGPADTRIEVLERQ